VEIGDDLTPDEEYLSSLIDLWEKNCYRAPGFFGHPIGIN
jgi:hypothetical protein